MVRPEWGSYAGSLAHIPISSAPLLPCLVPHIPLSCPKLSSAHCPQEDAAMLCYVHQGALHPSAYPSRDGLVTAAASLNCDPAVSLIAEVLYLGEKISKEEAE